MAFPALLLLVTILGVTLTVQHPTKAITVWLWLLGLTFVGCIIPLALLFSPLGLQLFGPNGGMMILLVAIAGGPAIVVCILGILFATWLSNRKKQNT